MVSLNRGGGLYHCAGIESLNWFFCRSRTRSFAWLMSLPEVGVAAAVLVIRVSVDSDLRKRND